MQLNPTPNSLHRVASYRFFFPLFLRYSQSSGWVRNLDEVLHENNPNKAWLSLISAVEKELDSTCRIRDIQIKKLKDDWVDNELLERIHHKDTLLKRAKKSKSGEYWTRARV